MQIVGRAPIRTALLAALAVTLPTVLLPFYMDDYFHLMAAEAWLGRDPRPLDVYFRGFVDPFGFLNLFGFFSGDTELTCSHLATGLIPWWTWPELRITFWRPLSSLSGLADVLVFGDRPAGYHLHSVLWYLGLVGSVGLLLRRVLPGGLLALTLLIFAIDETHTFPVGWVANRNALIAAVPGVLALAAHIRWRETGWRPGLPLSVLGLVLALLGGEAALGIFAYLAAYELLGAPSPLRDPLQTSVRTPLWDWVRYRVRGLAPAVTVGLFWALFYKSQGFGAHGSGLYLDPTREPLVYLQGALVRVPTLLAAQIGGMPSDLWVFVEPMRPVLLVYGLTVTMIAAVLLRWAWPHLSADEQRGLRWLIGGALLSLAPVIATFPLDRLLLLPGIGGSAVTAVLLRQGWCALHAAGRDRLPALILVPIGGVHLVLPPVFWAIFITLLIVTSDQAQQLIRDTELDLTRIEEQHVIVLNVSDPAIGIYMPMMMAWERAPTPDTWQVVSMSPFDHVLARPAERTLDLQIIDGHQGQAVFEQLFRGSQAPFEVGEQVAMTALTITIAEADEIGPTRLRLDFPADPGGGEYQFLGWRDGALRAVTLPRVGESLTLSWERGPMGI